MLKHESRINPGIYNFQRVFFCLVNKEPLMQRMPIRWISTSNKSVASNNNSNSTHEIIYRNMVGSCVPPILALCQLNADIP